VDHSSDGPSPGPYNRHLEIYSTQSTWAFQGFYDFITDQWYHIAIVRSGDNLQSYVDAVPLQSFGMPAGTNFNDAGINIHLGNDSALAWAPLTGGMDDVQIHNEALDQTDIAGIMNPETCRPPYWASDVNEDCFVNLLDLSELSNDWLQQGSDTGPIVFGDDDGQVIINPGGLVPPLMVKRTNLGGQPHGQAVAVFTNTINNEDVSIKMESTQEFASSNLWFSNTYHDVSGSLSMGVNPGTPAEMSIVFNEDSSTIPSSVPHPRFVISAGSGIIMNRAAGLSISDQTPREPSERLEVYGNVYISETSSGLILRSPDGNRWKLTVDNSGQLVITSMGAP
jgi:hypothetical protein